MRRTMTVGILCAGWAACIGCSVALPEPRLASQVRDECPRQDSATHFFPEGLGLPFRETDGDERERGYLANLLAAAGVASLSCGPGPDEAYRFVWFPAARPALVIEASAVADTWVIRSIEFEDPRQQQQQGRINRFAVAVKAEPRRLSSSEQQAVLAAVRTAQFWTAASSDGIKNVDDGAMWALEGRKAGSYRVAVLVNSRDVSVIRAGAALVRVAGLELPSQIAALESPAH